MTACSNYTTLNKAQIKYKNLFLIQGVFNCSKLDMQILSTLKNPENAIEFWEHHCTGLISSLKIYLQGCCDLVM